MANKIICKLVLLRHLRHNFSPTSLFSYCVYNQTITVHNKYNHLYTKNFRNLKTSFSYSRLVTPESRSYSNQPTPVHMVVGADKLLIRDVTYQRVKQYSSNSSDSNSGYSIKNNPNYRVYLDSLEQEYNAGSNASNNSGGYSRTNESFDISTVVLLFKSVKQKWSEIDELDSLIKESTDIEMVNMAKREIKSLQEEIEEYEDQLVLNLAGKSGVDQNNIILELSAGVGGAEAMLFTKQMLDMYQNFAANHGYDFALISYDSHEQGGVRKASASIQGDDAFKYFKFESGVHRVQRVPWTEKSGRVHTSTMTVAVLPEPKEIDVVINAKDLVVETFRAGGSGGQHVNTTDSAVRIIHVPTNTVVECQVERSQVKNRKRAMQILRTRIYETQLKRQTEKMSASRKLQIGTGSRSEKIRTYNFPQDRVSDHRVRGNIHNINMFMKGGEALGGLVETLLWNNNYDIVNSILDEYLAEKTRKAKK